MSVQTDPRDAAIVALREVLLETRSGMPVEAAQIDAVLRETEQVAQEAAQRLQVKPGEMTYNLADLRGAGAELWRQELAGRDAQIYVNEMRDEEWNGPGREFGK